MEPGRIGIVSRSATLACEVGRQLPMFGLGASKVFDLSASTQHGVTHLELLEMFNKHWGTDAVLLLGTIDADEEKACADWIAQHMRKPVISFIGDEGPAAAAQRELLRACGVHISADSGSVGELTASLVELPWLPFD
jgi:succinyl-CoA synthetase alpha subunit